MQHDSTIGFGRLFRSGSSLAVKILVVLLSTWCAGCLGHLELPWKSQSNKLEKPVIDQSTAQPAQTESRQAATPAVPPGQPPEQKTGTDAPPSAPPAAAVPPPKPTSSPDTQEEQTVRKAAFDKAAGMSAVEYMKICYLQDQDEWWVIFYDDIGPFIDLKQFIWNRDAKKLDRYLALKQILPAKIDSDIKTEEKGKRCEVHFRPRSGGSLYAWKRVDSRAVPVARDSPRSAESNPVTPARTPPAPSTPEPKAEAPAKPSPPARPPVPSQPPAVPAPSASSAPEDADSKAVMTFLAHWKAAWEEKDFERFRAMYHPDFRAGNEDYEAFLNKKRKFFNQYPFIRVEITKIQLTRTDGGVSVSFVQRFAGGDTYRDMGRKTLDLVPDGGKRLRIRSETFTAL